MSALAGSSRSAPVDEAALLVRLRAGEGAAYEILVRDYGGRMLAVARRILGDDDGAQDALQDAFVSAFKSLDSFQGGAQLSTWLQRITINAALMKLRSQRRRQEQDIESLLPEFTDNGHHAVEPRRWAESADTDALRAETRDVVRACIDKLPSAYRVALVLRDIEELDNEQVAEILGVSVNAAKIRVHRARQALRTLLDPHFGVDA
jgi:RNA polymerase sigma-70 factor, ECF subfamily